MKGLLLKDFYMSLRHCWYFGIFLVFWPLLLLAGAPPTTLILSCLLITMLPASIQAYDEKGNWVKYADTLPYTRAQIVSVKYILCFIAYGIMTSIAAVSMTINTLFIKTGTILSFGKIAFWCSVYLLICSVVSLMMPFVFLLGAEKGRYVYMVFGMLCGMTGVFMSDSFAIGPSMLLANTFTPLTTICVILCAVAIFAGSWGLSVLWYRRREL